MSKEVVAIATYTVEFADPNFVIEGHLNDINVDHTGFSLLIGEKAIPVDFDAYAISCHVNTVRYESGVGSFFKDYDISENYNDVYEELAINPEDITAEFLASTTAVIEGSIVITDLEDNCIPCAICLDSLEFVDEADKHYAVSEEALRCHSEPLHTSEEAVC